MIRQTKRKTSMRDVARDADVCIGSVSRILAGDSERFADATVARVKEAARRLNYLPNATARSLFSGSTQMAGVMVPSVGFYSLVVAGLNRALLEHGHVMLHAWNPNNVTTPDDPTEARIVHQMVERAVDGIILRPSSEQFEPGYFEEIWQRGIPLIVVDRELSLFKTDFVGTDDVAVGRAAARHLLEFGHRRLLFLGTAITCSTARLRGQGFRDVISETLDAACQSSALDGDPASIAETERILRGPDRPTAVFCYCDPGAALLLDIVERLGMKVPEDLSIIGCGNQAGLARLTTFDQDPLAIGRQAAALYLERVQKPNTRTNLKTIRLPAKLLVRRSTSTPCS